MDSGFWPSGVTQTPSQTEPWETGSVLPAEEGSVRDKVPGTRESGCAFWPVGRAQPTHGEPDDWVTFIDSDEHAPVKQKRHDFADSTLLIVEGDQ